MTGVAPMSDNSLIAMVSCVSRQRTASSYKPVATVQDH